MLGTEGDLAFAAWPRAGLASLRPLMQVSRSLRALSRGRIAYLRGAALVVPAGESLGGVIRVFWVLVCHHANMRGEPSPAKERLGLARGGRAPSGLSLEASRVSKVVSGLRLRPSLAVFITRPARVRVVQGLQQISVVVLRRNNAILPSGRRSTSTGRPKARHRKPRRARRVHVRLRRWRAGSARVMRVPLFRPGSFDRD